MGIEKVVNETGRIIGRIAKGVRNLIIYFSELPELDEIIKGFTTDHLTGLVNRRGFEVKLVEVVREWYRYKKDQEKKSQEEEGVIYNGKAPQYYLLLADLDNFKKVNDTLGHSYGDEVLKGVSKILNNGRPRDKVVRYGGDEFIIMIEDKKNKEKSEIYKSVENRIEEGLKEKYEDLINKYNFGISIGELHLNPLLEKIYDENEQLFEQISKENVPERIIKGIITKVDKLLYSAKETSKNGKNGSKNKEENPITKNSTSGEAKTDPSDFNSLNTPNPPYDSDVVTVARN